MYLKILTTILFLLFSGGEGENMITRQPAVAGQFYPYDRKELKSVIKKYIDAADDLGIKGYVSGLICPHAGYPFSGQTAAYAFRQIVERTYKTVVVIGPSHNAYFDGISIQPAGYFVTPLGSLEIDIDFVKKLYDKLDFSGYVKQADIPEHSIEVEIPFLQYVLGDFKLVPIIIGNQSMDILSELSSVLASISDEDVLFVASSDFYHGYDYNECLRKVDAAVDLIKKYDTESFYNLATEEKDIACGYGPIVSVMLTCNELGADNISLTGVTNSGDITRIKTPGRWVVGYSSFVIYKDKEKTPGSGKDEIQRNDTSDEPAKEEKEIIEGFLTEKEKGKLLEIARYSIECAAKGEQLPKAETEFATLEEKKGAFVTLEKHGHLRGCIGYIYPVKPLFQTINEMARQAAIGDPRFPPLKVDELPDIKIEISVLTPLKKIDNIEEIKVGKHGLYIVKGAFSGLLLPQVATDYGWDRETFLQQVSRKAGLPPQAWEDAELYIFEAEIFGED